MQKRDYELIQKMVEVPVYFVTGNHEQLVLESIYSLEKELKEIMVSMF